jgi:RHS repeat-associated protein
MTAIAATLSAALVVTTSELVRSPEPAAAAPVASSPARPKCPADRPDPVAAMVAAKLCGDRVEVLSQRTETTQVWARSEGGFTTEVYAGPVRVRQGTSWRPVDLTLGAGPDGTIAPAGHPRGLRLSGAAPDAGEHVLASLDTGGDTLGMIWTGPLPAPELAGHVATYRAVRPGVDLVVEATRTGFEQFLVVADRAAARRVASMTLPLRSRSLRFVPDGPASLAIHDAAGRALGRVPAPTMWDAKVGPAGERVREKTISVRTRPRGSSRTPATGSVDLHLSADQAWLDDPATTYPVRLDPQVDLTDTSDTFVRSDQTSTSNPVDNSAADYLAYGKASTYLARAFLQWPTAQFAGGRVTAATLHLWNWYSGSCSQTGWNVWNVAAYANPIYWNTAPARLNYDGYSTQTAGYDSSCNDNWVSASVQPFFQRAADARAGTAYMELNSYNETDPKLSWKQVRSLQSPDSSKIPYVTVTYDAAPLMSAPQAVPSSGACATGDGRPYLTSVTPQLRTTVSDADSVSTTVTFEWAAGGSKIGEATVGNVPSGSVAGTTVPAGTFAEGGTYAWRARATDGTYTSAWTPWCEYTVDTTKPAVPLVSSSLYPPTSATNTWGHGSYNQAGDFVLTPAGTSDLASFAYQLDNQPAPVTVPATGAATVSITPGEDGRRTLRVWARDRAGNQSEPAEYLFNVGRAGLTQPRPGANVVKRTRLAVDGDGTYTRARYQYRRGPGATEYDVPPANLTRAGGAAVGAYPVRLADLDGHAVWNALDTLGSTGGVVQVRATLYPDADNVPGYATQWITVKVDPGGEGATTADVGPGPVNLLTGDLRLSATDADDFGMAVSRTASSRNPADGWVAQGERLTAAQQQVTDLSGFGNGGTSTLVRSTAGGQGPSTDSLEIVPTLANSDTYAALGAEYTLSLGMKPGRRYRATAWIYVPAATGLAPAHWRGQRIVAFSRVGGAYRENTSAKATFVDGWQELTVDLDVPAGADQAFFRLYDGQPGGSGKVVRWDNLSVREIVAPYGPQWRGGGADGAASGGYETLSFPSPDVAKVTVTGDDFLTFGMSVSGQFFPEPGAEDLSLTRVDASTYRLAEVDGGYTDFTAKGGVFVATATRTDADSSTSQYVYDVTDGRTLLKKVINPRDPGVGDCTAATPAAGCQVLEYDYATSTTATGVDLTQAGDFIDRVSRVRSWAWNPATATVDAVPVVGYAYDNQGRLRKAWDPRPATPLVTTYDYDAAGRVTTLTPPGELPWQLDYGTAGTDPDAGRLLRVRRAALATGSRDVVDGEAVTTMAYNVPLTRAAGGPYDMDAAAVARWAQTDVPTDGTAVFPPEATPGPGGYPLATVHYLNAGGQEVDTATPGGHVDAQQYDEYGHAVWMLEAANRALALGTLPDAAARAAELNLPPDSAERARRLATIHTYAPDGVDLVDTLEPVSWVVLEDPLPTGTEVVGRRHTTRAYDEGKPDGAAYHLLTTETSGIRVDGTAADADRRATRHGYAAEKGGTSGWQLKKATSTITDATGTAVPTYEVFNAQGRIVRSYDVAATGTDARTTVSVYYSAGANADDSACGNKPQWAGLLCVTRAGGPVTGHDPARMTTDLPVTRVVEYHRTGARAVATETAGGKTRTSRYSFDAAGRRTREEITSDDGSAALPAVETEYDASSGRTAVTRAGTSTLRHDYDRLGRLMAYTDADGGVTRSEFDRYGNRTKVSDGAGSTTFAYDRAVEPRGLLTSLTDSVAGTFTARYAPDGQLVEMTYPGGLTRRDTLDATFTPVRRSYTRDSDGSVIFAESVRYDARDRQIGRVHTGGSQSFGYDRRDRLISAQQVAGGPCVTRTYGYDERGNRTTKRTYGPGSGGACRSDGTADGQETHTYDSADRVTDAGFTYDAFGRTTVVPGAPANTYYANDMVASQQLGDASLSWTLDPSRRLRGWTANRLNHYDDDSDEPRWIVENTTTGAVTRNVAGPDADLAATTSAGGDVRLVLTNLGGSVAATVDPALTAPEYLTYDEFGVPVTGQADPRYGWLGGKQRSGEALGDTVLMGVRLYSPALGRFLTVDPVRGGNATAYDYCSADPVNCSDLDGQKGGRQKRRQKKLSAAEQQAIDNQKAGRPYDQKLFKSAKDKQKYNEKVVSGERNKQKRQNNRRGGGNAKRVAGGIVKGIIMFLGVALILFLLGPLLAF